MLKIASYDIVFQEVPGETTLALNISGCPNRCPGCHSPHLWTDMGEPLTSMLLADLVRRYRTGITCVCFMGGDGEPQTVFRLAEQVHEAGLRTAWYSGRAFSPLAEEGLPSGWSEGSGALDFVKTGPYVEACGGLRSPSTNQRFYRRRGEGAWEDATFLFSRSNPDLLVSV
jgi:anaerobic ribonucleoside-triphosphate reductase activating protein